MDTYVTESLHLQQKKSHRVSHFQSHRNSANSFLFYIRLISKNTIEENILKKANQKRLLGDLTIDGGNFNVNYFKKVFLIFK